MTRLKDENGKTIRVHNGRYLCTKCNEYLPPEAFTESQRNGWGYCKECVKKKNKEITNV